MRTCVMCGEEFDQNAPAKRKAGGRIVDCPDCSEESVVRYAGVQAADGKQAQATILKFNSDKDRTKYLAFWQNNSGYHKSKSCQLGNHLSTDPGIHFETRVAHNPTNHKGKM